eukprot:TRINITY_DN6538_c0_g1_i2.p1 TRINITY_DN6538_c0_g1~~TRINITY_DN6538_c0_g1_i2.p1  ORF type:complete len:253 (+),score=26.50 TRINITY_DN6538_c0_g1_i2:59-817(+)
MGASKVLDTHGGCVLAVFKPVLERCDSSMGSFADEGSSREDSCSVGSSGEQVLPWWWKDAHDGLYTGEVMGRYERELGLNQGRGRNSREPLEYISSIERRPVIGCEGVHNWVGEAMSYHGLRTWDTITVMGLQRDTEPRKITRVVCWDDDGIPKGFYAPVKRRDVAKFERSVVTLAPTYLTAVPPDMTFRCRVVYKEGGMVPHQHSRCCGFEWHLTCSLQRRLSIDRLRQANGARLPLHGCKQRLLPRLSSL